MFQWTTEADEAFRRMKELLEALPMILARPKKSGRIAKWVIELGEHEIEFKGRNSVKGHILADFLAETPLKEEEEAKRKEPEPEKAWKLFTDRASSSNGSEAGLILVSPKGKEYTYALRFEFKTTNNEAEYEALLAEKAKELLANFPCHLIEHIKRDQNKKANALSKLALMTFSKLTKEVFVEVIQDKSITQKEVADVTQEKEDSWMIPIREYLQLGKLLDDPQKARKLRIKASIYRIMDEKQYRRSYLLPWLRCPRSVVSKIIRLGYYWPSMHKDAKAPGGARFLVVAINYFTKWVKVKPLTSTTGKHMERFVWEHIVCRVRTPQIIILDNGKQFAEGTFLVFCQKLGILQSFTSVYHPQANGQVEVTNREIVKGIERRLGKTHQGWVDELPQVMWAHRRTSKSSNGETPFNLVYGSEAVIPIEIGIETQRVQDFNPKQNEKRCREDLDILKERREVDSIKQAHYKQKLEGYYNKRVRPSTFKPESSSPEFDHISDIEEQSEEEVRETMTKTMEQYMSKTQGDYGSGVTRPTINQDTHFELKGQFLKELRNNTFSGSKHEDANRKDGLAAIQAQLNNLGREIKKLNEKVYVAQVGCELCKGPHNTKDRPQKEEGNILEEAYYTQFRAPYQPGGQYRAAGPEFNQ
ncbi:reverse transcriptase domain-containing protein [Tanacetum coccineum]